MTQRKCEARWQKENTVMVAMRLQKSTDADILAFLEGKAKQTEIKKAIRFYLANHKQEYRYGMRLRGYAPGAQPKGAVRREDDTTGKYHDIIVYDRKLSADEVNSYDLNELVEV